MSELGRLMRMVYTPRGEDTLQPHLERVYGISVSDVAPLDMGVYRVDRRDGPSWVARVFVRGRPLARVRGDAELLDFLAQRDFPAERIAAEPAVSVLDDQPVLVTEYVAGKAPGKSRRAIARMADLLGRLHAMPVGALTERPGGSLHHVPGFEGLPGEDLRLAAALLDDIDARIPPRNRAPFERLRADVSGAGDGNDLPRSWVHPDPVLKNMIAAADRSITLVDWAGAGVGPRLFCLAQFLGVAQTTSGWDRAKLGVIAAAYGAHVQLGADEIERLGEAVRIRRLWLAAWNYWTRTMRGKVPKGDEWWLRRTAPLDGSLVEAVRSAFLNH